MAAGASNTFWSMSLITALPSAAVCFSMEKRRRAAMPETMPYTWGIYIGMNAVLLGLLIILAGLLGSGDSGGTLGVLLIGGVYALAGYFTLRRYRAAFIVATMLSFNVIWWIANSIYIRNRWSELRRVRSGEQHTIDAPATRRSTPAQDMSKDAAPERGISDAGVPGLPGVPQRSNIQHTTGQGTFE